MIAHIKNLIEKDKKTFYLFGAGEYGREIAKSLSIVGIRYRGIFDNTFPNGGEKSGLEILPLNILSDSTCKEDIYIIIVCEHENSIREQLLGYGIKNIISMRQLAMPYIDKFEMLHFKQPAEPLVSILITAYNGWNFTYVCLKALAENENQCNFEVILGDDHSTDETCHAEAYVEGIKIIHHPTNLQYLRNVNEIAKEARGKYIMLLANDVILDQKRYLDRMVDKLEADEKIGLLGGKLWVPIKNQYVVGRNFIEADRLASVQEDIEQNVEEIQPASVMIRRNVWDMAGGYDEVYLPVYWEDLDLMMKIGKLGYMIRYSPELESVHFHGSTYSANTIGNESYKKNRLIFIRRWGEYIENKNREKQEL